tara:strand:- start:1182 stop:1715 length:534 start_codon:yes stop_codon:yes gene_type:complete
LSISEKLPNIETRTVVALVEDRPGVLARIAGFFRRQGFNIESLAVGKSEKIGLSRMTFVVEGPPDVIGLVAAKLDRLIEIVEVTDITDQNFAYREMALIKINADEKIRGEILQLANVFRVRVVDVGTEEMTIETTGDSKKINSLIELMNQYGILEIMRTGRVAVLRSSLEINKKKES